MCEKSLTFGAKTFIIINWRRVLPKVHVNIKKLVYRGEILGIQNTKN